MTKIEIEKALNVLRMVTGDCPYERGIGKEENYNCHDFNDCLDCWRSTLNKQLAKIKSDELKNKSKKENANDKMNKWLKGL